MRERHGPEAVDGRPLGGALFGGPFGRCRRAEGNGVLGVEVGDHEGARRQGERLVEKGRPLHVGASPRDAHGHRPPAALAKPLDEGVGDAVAVRRPVVETPDPVRVLGAAEGGRREAAGHPETRCEHGTPALVGVPREHRVLRAVESLGAAELRRGRRALPGPVGEHGRGALPEVPHPVPGARAVAEAHFPRIHDVGLRYALGALHGVLPVGRGEPRLGRAVRGAEEEVRRFDAVVAVRVPAGGIERRVVKERLGVAQPLVHRRLRRLREGGARQEVPGQLPGRAGRAGGRPDREFRGAGEGRPLQGMAGGEGRGPQDGHHPEGASRDCPHGHEGIGLTVISSFRGFST